MRQKKKKIIVAAIAGFGAGILPAAAVAGIMWSKYRQLDGEIKGYRDAYAPYTAYVLNRDGSRGDVIETEDMEAITFYSANALKNVDISSLEGKVLRQKTDKGIIITPSMVYEDMGISDNLRTYMFDYIVVPENIEPGTLFDIRIWYPNGEDYIIAKGKTLQSRSEAGVFINATEKELLMISSAYVDTNIYEGAKIYASVYVTDYQELSVVNYPVNMYVTKLSDWNPNLIKEIEEDADADKRQILEENLYDFMGVSMGNTYYE